MTNLFIGDGRRTLGATYIFISRTRRILNDRSQILILKSLLASLVTYLIVIILRNYYGIIMYYVY